MHHSAIYPEHNFLFYVLLFLCEDELKPWTIAPGRLTEHGDRYKKLIGRHKFSISKEEIQPPRNATLVGYSFFFSLLH